MTPRSPIRARRRLSAAMLTIVALVCGWTAVCRAAGMTLAPRGTQALGRGGAFIAGARGPDALTHNPAGLIAAPASLSVDVVSPIFVTTYRRSVQDGAESHAPVQGRPASWVIPSLAISHGFGWREDVVFGAGIFTDVPTLQNWPDEVDGQPAAQRYAVGNYRGSALAKGALGGALRLPGGFEVGVSAMALVGKFVSESAVSVCDGFICSQPENPDFDSRARVSTDAVFAPGIAFGVKGHLSERLTVGLAWESGYRLDAGARLDVRIPSAPAYEGAVLEPAEPRARVRLRMPMSVRAGLEAVVARGVAVELAAVYEPWSVHESIDIEADGVSLTGVVGIDEYRVESMNVRRGFRDTGSVRLGGTWLVSKFVALHSGLMWERSAVDETHLTAMTVDMDKFMFSAGIETALSDLRLAMTAAWIYMPSRTVTDGAIYQVNPSRPPYGEATAIGEGRYEATAFLLGLQLRYLL